MGLLDKTIFAQGEPYSYDGNSGKRKLRPMDGSSLPLENTDFSAETLDRLVGKNVISPASDYFHLGGEGEVSEEVTQRRESRDRKLALEEQKTRDEVEARERAARETWRDIEGHYGEGKSVVVGDRRTREGSRDEESRDDPLGSSRGSEDRDTDPSGGSGSSSHDPQSHDSHSAEPLKPRDSDSTPRDHVSRRTPGRYSDDRDTLPGRDPHAHAMDMLGDRYQESRDTTHTRDLNLSDVCSDPSGSSRDIPMDTTEATTTMIPKEESQAGRKDVKPPKGGFERETPSYLTRLPRGEYEDVSVANV